MATLQGTLVSLSGAEIALNLEPESEIESSVLLTQG
jgi:hypothetical protein